MSTTSLKLPEDVKRLAAAAAKHQGITPHAFMIDAIRVAAEAAEKRAAFVAEAVASREETIESGKAFSVADVHGYIRARTRGKTAAKPKAGPWRT